jgi:tryptophanyl-tRNA synthetase
MTLDCVRDYLALGLDPARATIFLQSDVTEVCELAWILSTVTPMGLLQRCHAYKDKVAQGLAADHGLFAYPVLMAADILIYDAQVVPVGQDQVQHVEVTRDIAGRFNNVFGDILTVPEARLVPELADVPGTDGRKMSKSYGNAIGIFDNEDEVRSAVMGIKTDSKGIDEPKDPDQCNLFALFKLVAGTDERREVEERYRTGGIAYREMKERLHELIVGHFAPAREGRREIASNDNYVHDVLNEGRRRAVRLASETMNRVRRATGLLRTGQCPNRAFGIGHA